MLAAVTAAANATPPQVVILSGAKHAVRSVVEGPRDFSYN